MTLRAGVISRAHASPDITMFNRGNALVRLGEREIGTARLEQVVAAYDACLTVVETVWPPELVEQLRSHSLD
jgi:hypothetical protein